MLSTLIFSLIVGGCSQSTQQAEVAKPAEQTAEGKQEEKPKSDFPNKPIQMVMPFAPGGAYDTIGRTLAKVAPKYLPNGQSVVVANKPGGGNTLGVVEVFKAQPDGYTIGYVPSSTITIHPHHGNTPYTYDSFQTIMRTMQADGFVLVKGDAPWKTFEEWLDYVKANPEGFSVSTVAGAKPVLERINRDLGIQMKIVVFDGSSPALTAFLGGHVDATIGVPAEAKAMIESGEIRQLFSTSGRDVGDVPTLKEKGYKIEENKYTGIIAPKGLPQEELKILHDAFKQALEDPEVVDQMRKLGYEPYYGGPEEFQKNLEDNFKIDGDNLREMGLIK